MHKKDVRNVNLNRLSILAKLNKTSNDFNVRSASKRLSGKLVTTENIVNATGLSYGLQKATTSDNYAIYQDTAISNSRASKTTGLGSCLKNGLITNNTNMSFMMPLIFTKMAA